MATEKENRIINGQMPNASLREMKAAVAELNFQLRNLSPSMIEAFTEQAKQLQAFSARIKSITRDISSHTSPNKFE